MKRIDQLKKSRLYIPLILVELYLGFTILLYQFGPLDWKTENEAMFWTFLALYHLAFIFGYVFSMEKIRLNSKTWNGEKINNRWYSVIVWSVIGLCVVCACIEYKNLTHSDSYIPYDLPKNFILGLTNPAQQYYNKFVSEDYVSNKLVTIFSALFSFVYVSLIPLLIVEWKRLSTLQKGFLFGIILFKVVAYVSIATNKGIFDTMFGFVGMLVVLLLLNFIHQTDEFIDKMTFIKVAAFALFLVVFSFSYFTANISSRVSSPVEYAMNVAGQEATEATETTAATETAATTEENAATETAAATEETAATETAAATEETAATETAAATEETAATETTAATEASQTVEEEPKKDSFLKRMFYSVSNYLCQGYYGMSLSLDEEFTTTYGIGNSQFLRSNFKSLFGIDVKDRTYQHKITEQWDEDQQWHSFYSYIANDVSFYGVIVVMLLLGLFYGCICKDVILNNSLIGMLLLPLFIIMFMYMPANNQVFTSMATCTAFLELSFFWILSKINWKKGRKNGK